MEARTTIRGGSRAGLATRLAFALAALGSFAAVAPPGASASSYIVHVCTADAAGNDLELTVDPGTVGFSVRQTCTTPSSAVTQIAGGNSLTGGSTWALRAPPGTTIQTLGGVRELTGWENPDIIWEIRNGTDRLERISSDVPDAPRQYTVNSDIVFASLQCTRRPCLPLPGKPSLHMEIGLRDVVATVDDSVPPTAAVDPLGSGPVRGVVEIPYVARDVGSGVAETQLLVDGLFVASASDSNEGKCVDPYRFMAPCKPELRSSLPLDTTTLRDGRHEVRVLVTDGTELSGESALVPIEVRNAPAPVGPPPTADPPHEVDRTAPVLSGVSLSRKRFRGGSALRFTSSEAGTLSIVISKAKKGARATAALTLPLSTGSGKVPLGGRVGGKALRPGRYRLAVSARDAAGNASRPIVLPFTILPPE
jgi:hypothetical protein